ncbi:MAG: Gfo/Idh/MocA family oxidoreductase [Ostreibacterium sp.]
MSIGMGWMGEVHSNGYAQLKRLSSINDYTPKLIICSDILSEKVKMAAKQFDFVSYTTDWHEVIEHPDVDVVDITAPNR